MLEGREYASLEGERSHNYAVLESNGMFRYIDVRMYR